MCSPSNTNNFRALFILADQLFRVHQIRRFFFYQLFSTCHSNPPPVTVFLTGNQETRLDTSRARMNADDGDDPTSTMTVTLTVRRPAVTRTCSALRNAAHFKHGNLPETNRITVNINRNQG
jgi:hypothetical protein